MLACPSHSCTLAMSASWSSALVAAVARSECTPNPSMFTPTRFASAPYIVIDSDHIRVLTIGWESASGVPLEPSQTIRCVLTIVQELFDELLHVEVEHEYVYLFNPNVLSHYVASVGSGKRGKSTSPRPVLYFLLPYEDALVDLRKEVLIEGSVVDLFDVDYFTFVVHYLQTKFYPHTGRIPKITYRAGPGNLNSRKYRNFKRPFPAAITDRNPW